MPRADGRKATRQDEARHRGGHTVAPCSMAGEGYWWVRGGWSNAEGYVQCVQGGGGRECGEFRRDGTTSAHAGIEVLRSPINSTIPPTFHARRPLNAVIG